MSYPRLQFRRVGQTLADRRFILFRVVLVVLGKKLFVGDDNIFIQKVNLTFN